MLGFNKLQTVLKGLDNINPNEATITFTPEKVELKCGERIFSVELTTYDDEDIEFLENCDTDYGIDFDRKYQITIPFNDAKEFEKLVVNGDSDYQESGDCIVMVNNLKNGMNSISTFEVEHIFK